MRQASPHWLGGRAAFNTFMMAKISGPASLMNGLTFIVGDYAEEIH
ncbi:MAG: hypothetical protein QOK48_805 [Blastocatellia bacterium]|nr:hypothetical protein [Blastocatellia bacterium]